MHNTRINILWWRNNLLRYNLIFILSGLFFLMIAWAIMWLNQNFINLFFFIPSMIFYVITVNVTYLMAPYLIPHFLKIVNKFFRINDSIQNIFRYYSIFTVLLNSLLFIYMILEFKLYDKSYLHWP